QHEGKGADQFGHVAPQVLFIHGSSLPRGTRRPLPGGLCLSGRPTAWLSKRERPSLSSCYGKLKRRQSVLLLLLLCGQFHQGLGGADQAFPVLFHVLRRAALAGDVLRDGRRGHHVDRVPRAPPLAQRTADAAFQIDVTEGLKAWLILSGDLVNAVDRADLDTSFATCTVVRTDDGQLLG